MAWLEKKKKPKRWVLLAITNGLNQKILAHLLTDCFRYNNNNNKKNKTKRLTNRISYTLRIIWEICFLAPKEGVYNNNWEQNFHTHSLLFSIFSLLSQNDITFLWNDLHSFWCDCFFSFGWFRVWLVSLAFLWSGGCDTTHSTSNGVGDEPAGSSKTKHENSGADGPRRRRWETSGVEPKHSVFTATGRRRAVWPDDSATTAGSWARHWSFTTDGEIWWVEPGTAAWPPYAKERWQEADYWTILFSPRFNGIIIMFLFLFF